MGQMLRLLLLFLLAIFNVLRYFGVGNFAQLNGVENANLENAFY